MAECFCGCGRKVRLRRRRENQLGRDTKMLLTHLREVRGMHERNEVPPDASPLAWAATELYDDAEHAPGLLLADDQEAILWGLSWLCDALIEEGEDFEEWWREIVHKQLIPSFSQGRYFRRRCAAWGRTGKATLLAAGLRPDLRNTFRGGA